MLTTQMLADGMTAASNQTGFRHILKAARSDICDLQHSRFPVAACTRVRAPPRRLLVEMERSWRGVLPFTYLARERLSSNSVRARNCRVCGGIWRRFVSKRPVSG